MLTEYLILTVINKDITDEQRNRAKELSRKHFEEIGERISERQHKRINRSIQTTPKKS